MSEESIQANRTEALRLYQRGVAVAKSGNKRMAAGLLMRAIRYDPNFENCWLWLAGVLEDPHERAFCVEAVLKMNPANERAQHALRWLEHHYQLQGESRPPAPIIEEALNEPAEQREARTQSVSWWVGWRQLRRDRGRLRLLIWSVPIFLLLVAIGLNQAFTTTIEQTVATPTLPVVVATGAAKALVPPTMVPILETAPASLEASLTVGYLSAVAPIRQQLRDAVEVYRDATNQPGGSSVAYVAAAERLRTTVAESRGVMQQLQPPHRLLDAHKDYLHALELESKAISDILEFYGNYQVEAMNRAALAFQQASALITRASRAFGDTKTQSDLVGAFPAMSVR